MALWPEHICEHCGTKPCPKRERYNEVSLIFVKHADEIEKEIKSRPRDTEHEEYELRIPLAPIIVKCPYFSESRQVDGVRATVNYYQ